MSAQTSMTYAGYLRLDEVLSAQHPVAPPEHGPQVHAAEHFFIVVHQAFELWFKQTLLDLECATGELARAEPDPELGLEHLLRVASIQRLLVQQMILFDHLAPQSFLAFRGYLGTASGSESAQFRAVQKALGLRGQAGSPVYRAFADALARTGFSLDDLYRNPSRGGALYRIAEALVDISEGFWELCAVHVQIAERTIGRRPGTGGTAGVPYLEEGLKEKAFPELWDVRTRL
jgi:tryptophan 2,3-dioxygenase